MTAAPGVRFFCHERLRRADRRAACGRAASAAIRAVPWSPGGTQAGQVGGDERRKRSRSTASPSSLTSSRDGLASMARASPSRPWCCSAKLIELRADLTCSTLQARAWPSSEVSAEPRERRLPAEQADPDPCEEGQPGTQGSDAIGQRRRQCGDVQHRRRVDRGQCDDVGEGPSWSGACCLSVLVEAAVVGR